jgi:TonB family protein
VTILGAASAARHRVAAIALILILGSGCATSSGVTPPSLVGAPPQTAEYPPEAKRLGLEGIVDMRVMLGEDGAVKSITFTHAAGNGFDEAAVDYIRRTKFAPARTRDGRGIPAEIKVRMKFSPRGIVTGSP